MFTYSNIKQRLYEVIVAASGGCYEVIPALAGCVKVHCINCLEKYTTGEHSVIFSLKMLSGHVDIDPWS